MNVTALFDAMLVDLPDDVSEGQMFGGRALTLDGQPFACLRGEEMAFKLGADTAELNAAMALDDVRAFDPAGDGGQPFVDWVLVPEHQCSEWGRLCGEALTAQRARQG